MAVNQALAVVTVPREDRCDRCELYLAKIQHPAEVLDDGRHLCDLLPALFKLGSHAVASAYVSTHLQTAQDTEPLHMWSLCKTQQDTSTQMRDNA